MVAGSYSSILVAAPVLGLLKRHDKNWEQRNIPRAVGEPLRDMVMGAGIGSRRTRAAAAADDDGDGKPSRKPKQITGQAPVATGQGLTHPPRPRKKKRR
jgi:hypothetical protein